MPVARDLKSRRQITQRFGNTKPFPHLGRALSYSRARVGLCSRIDAALAFRDRKRAVGFRGNQLVQHSTNVPYGTCHIYSRSEFQSEITGSSHVLAWLIERLVGRRRHCSGDRREVDRNHRSERFVRYSFSEAETELIEDIVSEANLRAASKANRRRALSPLQIAGSRQILELSSGQIGQHERDQQLTTG